VDGGLGAIEAIREAGGTHGAQIVVLCDVRTPWEQAAEVFGPQKGANPEQVRTLVARLDALAAELPRDPRGLPMTGAAGGFSGGMWAAFDAKLEPGGPFVLDAVDYDTRARAARAVIVGEGRLDETTLQGKAAGEAATRARQAGVPCHAIVGSNGMTDFQTRMLDLQHVLEATTIAELEAAGEELGRRIG
nr:glycerate kinase [Solirubrobacterales bacterium]